MSTQRLAIDDEGNRVQLMALGSALTVAIASTATLSAELPVGDRIGVFVSIWASAACHLALGDATVVATTADHRIEAETRREFYVPRDTPYLSTIRAAGDGTLYVSTLSGTR